MKTKAKRNPAPVRSSRSSPAGWIALLAALGIGAYWNSFGVPFVFDDLLTIKNNPGVRFGDFLAPQFGATRPVLYLTFTLNYLAHGMEVWGYHLVNLLLHLLTGVVLFFIAQNLIGRVFTDESKIGLYSFLGAAFFVLHPLQTESVTYISSRSETLSTLFFLAGVLMFLKRRVDGIGFLWSLVLLVPFGLGMLSKETVISLPAVLLILDYVFLSAGDFRQVLRRWPFYSTFIVVGLIASYYVLGSVLVNSIGAGVQNNLSPHDYFLTQLRVITTYIRLILFPVGLNLDHDFRPSSSFLEPSVILSFLFLASLLSLVWYLRKKEPVFAVSVFWFFVTLAPTSSVIPIHDTIAEHRLYLALAGIALSFPFLAGRAIQSLKRYVSFELVPVCAAVLTVLFVATIMRNQVWATEISLWTDVVSKSTAKARAYNNLAIAHSNRGEYERAVAVLNDGLAHVQDKVDRRAFIEAQGNMYMLLGRWQEAVDAFVKTTEVDDKKSAAFAYNNLGVTYLRMLQDLESRRAGIGEVEFRSRREKALAEAEKALSKSMELDPSFFWPYDSYISVVFEQGKADEFCDRMKTVIREHPDARASYGLGKMAMLKGDFSEAADRLKQATALNGSEKVAFLHLGYSLSQLQRLDEAAESYVQALRLDPQYIDAHHNLGLVYSQQKQFPKALENFQDVLSVDPNNLSAHLEMAKIFIQTGDRRQARQHLTLILSLTPQDEAAKQLWQMTGS